MRERAKGSGRTGVAAVRVRSAMSCGMPAHGTGRAWNAAVARRSLRHREASKGREAGRLARGPWHALCFELT